MIDEIAKALDRFVYRASSERELQDAIASALGEEGIAFVREFILSRTQRLDFLCGDNIAIEVKIKGSLAQLTRQIFGYLQDHRIEGIVVVTTRARHRDLPREILGKPVRVVWVTAF